MIDPSSMNWKSTTDLASVYVIDCLSIGERPGFIIIVQQRVVVSCPSKSQMTYTRLCENFRMFSMCFNSVFFVYDLQALSLITFHDWNIFPT